MKKGKPLYERIAEEVMDELITAGLAFLIILFGVNYFNFKYAWVTIISTLSEQTGISDPKLAAELTTMLQGISQSFPLKYLLGQQNIVIGLIIGIALTALGIVLKILTKASKEEFIKDMGRNIYVPAIVGFLSMITLQIIIAVFAHDNFSGVTELESGLFIWKTYGQLVLIGVTTIILGSVTRLIADKQRSVKLKFMANVVLHGSYICLVYYAILRLFAVNFILNSELGNFFKVFLVSGDVSAYVIIFCIFMFTLGLEMQKYGKFLERMQRKNLPYSL